MKSELSPEDNEIFHQILTKMVDRDHNGTIEYSEFVEMCVSRQKLLSRENLIKAFRQIDYEN